MIGEPGSLGSSVTVEAQVSRAATLMGAATAVSRIIGFGRVLVIAAVLGTTDLGNTFSASNSVSNVLFDLLAAGALSAVLVPAFVALLDRGDDAAAEDLGGALLGRALVVLVPVCLAGVVAAPWLARGLVAGTSDPAVQADQRQLATFLLRLFIPQVLLYAYGAVATAVLHAKRHFTVTAVAPIGNTVVMVAALVAFRALHGAGHDFDLSLAEKLALAAAGTMGVAAFVGIPALALRAAGFKLWPRRLSAHQPDSPELGVSQAVRLAGWAGLQHAGTGILLGGALLVGMGVTGGVVAYQVAFAIFLVPYAVLSLPMITAVLPELAGQAGRGALDDFGRSLRWALESMVWLVVPVSVAALVFAPRAMEALAFGETSGAGGRLIGAAVATLGIGLLPYAAFLLFVRAYYALGQGRRPAMTALLTATAGAGLMTAAGLAVDGPARLAVMGAAHSAAYLAGAWYLGADLQARTGQSLMPAGLVRSALASAAVGLAAAGALAAIDPDGRMATLGTVGGLGVAGAVAYAAVARRPALRRLATR